MNSEKIIRLKKIALMFLFNVILFASFLALNCETVYTHEYTHKEIAENHGCVDWEIHKNGIAGGSFECYEYQNNDYDIRMQEAMLHSVNEIVGYNISSLISAICIAVLVLMNTLFIIWIIL